MKRLFLKAAGVAAAGALLEACGGGGGGGGGGVPTGAATLLQVVQQDSRFSSLLGAVQSAGLTGQLAQAGANQTLFAPTNEAFSALASRVGPLSNGLLTDILNFHLVPQFLSAATLTSLGAPGGDRPATLYSFRGEPAVLIFVYENNQLNIWDGIGRASITLGQTDVAASNGVLHVVNDVLLPGGVLTVSKMLQAITDFFSKYGESMNAAGVSAELDGAGPYTVFVPIDEAISGSLAANVVRHHVGRGELGSGAFPPVNNTVTLTPLAGQNIRLTTRAGSSANGRTVLATLSGPTTATTLANVIDVDFFGSNGVIHLIDQVLV